MLDMQPVRLNHPPARVVTVVQSHRIARPRPMVVSTRSAASDAGPKTGLEAFPIDYPAAIQQMQGAVQAALADGATLLEIEFPTSGLASVAGDGEGANEMTNSLRYMRQFCRIFQDRANRVRIFFPDDKELMVAIEGKAMDPNAGSWTIDPVFEATRFQLDYLTKPTALMDLGIDIHKRRVGERVQDSDEVLVAAYPHFSPSEMVAVGELWQTAAAPRGIPLLIFNGELDRLRNGYYPSLFYPKLARLSKELLPQLESAYYIHNFKGSKGGALFRCYPGPWQVLSRGAGGLLRVVHTQEQRPSLKQVALEILPAAKF